MNPCVKTGVWFRVDGTDLIGTGDLFYDGDQWQIRGIPKGMPNTEHCHFIDIVVDGFELYTRPAPHRFNDSCFGIEIVACSREFKQHIEKWYPALLPQVMGLVVG